MTENYNNNNQQKINLMRINQWIVVQNVYDYNRDGNLCDRKFL